MITSLFSDLKFNFEGKKRDLSELGNKLNINLNQEVLDIGINKQSNEPDFLAKDFFSKKSGSIDYQKNQILIEDIKKNDWKSAISQYFSGDSDAKKRVFSSLRTNWMNLIDINDDSLILDYGCGFGSVSVKLSKQYRVVSVDKSMDNLKILNEIRIQDKLKIIPVCIQDYSLPFDDNSFELVYLIGSLEWLPFDFDEDPEDVIKKYLSEFYRVLKPGGKIFIASENSNYIGYYYGIPESHTGIKYLSLFENDKAQQISKNLRNRGFKELTFDYDSISEILKKTGFNFDEFYWLYPDYSTPHQIIPLSKNENLIKFYIENKMNPWEFIGQREDTYSFLKLLKTNHVKYFIEHYGVIAHK